jgi:hypothetical protein
MIVMIADMLEKGVELRMENTHKGSLITENILQNLLQ